MTIQVLSEKHVAARAIARQLGVTEGTVRYHLGRARQSAVDGRKGKRFVAAEFVDAIDAWLAESGRDDRPVNARDLYEHLARVRGYRHSYKSVLRYLRRRFGYPRIRTYRRVETPPGAQSQTDWGEFPKIDLGYGPQRVHAFVMALSFSRRPAIVWSLREDQVSWLACHNRAFERLGGIAAVNRIDNLRTAIAQGAGAWGTIHPTYRSYARSVGFHIDACLPRCPEDKGKVENKVGNVRRRLRLCGQRFGALEFLQAQTDEDLAGWDRRRLCPATGDSVEVSWQAEQPLLRPLPPVLPLAFDVAVTRPVHKDCTIGFEGRVYSVPFLLCGHSVEVHGCAEVVQVLYHGKVVAECDPQRETAARLASLMVGAELRELQLPPPVGEEADVRLSIRNLSMPRPTPFAVELDDVSLDVRAGEILGVAGIAGNGQDEIFAALSGERLAARADAVMIDSRPCGHRGVTSRRKMGAAFVPEERLGRGAVPSMSLAQNTLLTRREPVGRLGHVSTAKAAALARRLIERFGVRAAGPQAAARSLSGGNLQKFIMGREIDAAPKALIVAQPTWGVDVGAAAQIRAELLALRDAGCALLGYTREELLMTPVSSIHPSEMTELNELLERVLRYGRASTIKLTCRTKQGTFLPTEISLHALELEGQTRVLGLVQDRSEHRQAVAR